MSELIYLASPYSHADPAIREALVKTQTGLVALTMAVALALAQTALTALVALALAMVLAKTQTGLTTLTLTVAKT